MLYSSFDAKIFSVIKDNQWRLLNLIEIWCNINPWIKTFNFFTILPSQLFFLTIAPNPNPLTNQLIKELGASSNQTIPSGDRELRICQLSK